MNILSKIINGHDLKSVQSSTDALYMPIAIAGLVMNLFEMIIGIIFGSYYITAQNLSSLAFGSMFVALNSLS